MSVKFFVLGEEWIPPAPLPASMLSDKTVLFDDGAVRVQFQKRNAGFYSFAFLDGGPEAIMIDGELWAKHKYGLCAWQEVAA